MSSIVVKEGGLHLNAKHSNDEWLGRGRGDNSRSRWWNTARPPPRPVLRDFSMYL